MVNIDEALRIVEAAGYTVTDDKRLHDYYAKQNDRLNTLLDRANKGDWVAAENLLKSVSIAPMHICYSTPLMDFMVLITKSLLSRKAITSARKSNKRLKNPLLAAALGTDSRKDYQLTQRKRQLKIRHDAHVDNGTKLIIKPLELNDFLAKSEGITVEQYNKWLKAAKNM
ncbi:MAG: hypothetical protein Q7U15_12355 [Methylotenera sp.]|nr:hypothetical protein [Methylotenera sp.]